MTTTKENCETCRFFEKHDPEDFGTSEEEQVLKELGVGNCKRFPPVLINKDAHTIMSWCSPMVCSGQWCGEHKQKEQQ